MRTKVKILESERRNALKAAFPKDISLIHSLLQLEAIIDIRDIIDYGFRELSRAVIYTTKKD